MAAGLGFKTFNTGDVLTAADANGYLMQGVWVFASSAARSAAVTSPQEGNVSYLSDTNSLEIYDGTSWVGYGSGDITGVTAGTGISGGGTSGTVTVTNSMATTIDAKGDLIVGTGNDTFARLAVGATNNHVLTVDSSTATGLKYAAVPSGFVFLNATTLTSSTSTSVNNVFSSTYKHYLILVEGSITTNNASTPRLKLRVSGTDSSASYNNQGTYGENTTTASFRETNVTTGFLAGESNFVSTIQKSYHSFRLVDPGTAVRTSCIGDGGNNLQRTMSLGMHDVATAYDGFTIVTTYSFSGTVRTYGLAES